MDFFSEFSLAIAVGMPIAVIVGMNVFLALGGERGTLLLPGIASYPSIELEKRAQSVEVAIEPIEIVAKSDAPVGEPANDMLEREAA